MASGSVEKEAAAWLWLRFGDAWLGDEGECAERGLACRSACWCLTCVCCCIDTAFEWRKEKQSAQASFYALFSLAFKGSPGLPSSALPRLRLMEVEMSRSKELGRQADEEKLSWGFRNGPFPVPQ